MSNMDWKIEYSELKGVVRLDLAGHYSADDLLKALTELTSKPYWHPGIHLLTNNLKVDITDIRTPDVEVMAQLMDKFRMEFGNARIAAVVGSDEQFGLTRQLQAYINGTLPVSFGVFHDEASAVSWLDNSGNVVN